MSPEQLLASALATASALLDELERPAAGRPSLHVRGREARADVWDGCEIARRAAHLAGPYGCTRDALMLCEEIRAVRPERCSLDFDRGEAWDAGVALIVRGLSALDALAHGPGQHPHASPPVESVTIAAGADGTQLAIPGSEP